MPHRGKNLRTNKKACKNFVVRVARVDFMCVKHMPPRQYHHHLRDAYYWDEEENVFATLTF
jgi:hypothetical protein